MAVRSDEARRRPEVVRYFYLAEGDGSIHVGTTLGALRYARDRHGVHTVYLADIVTGRVERVREPLDEFMARWRQHYDDPDWQYSAEAPGQPPVAPALAPPAPPDGRAGGPNPADPPAPGTGNDGVNLEAAVAAAVRETLHRLGLLK